MFYLHVKILHRGYLVLIAVLCKRLHHRFTDIPFFLKMLTFFYQVIILLRKKLYAFKNAFLSSTFRRNVFKTWLLLGSYCTGGRRRRSNKWLYLCYVKIVKKGEGRYRYISQVNGKTPYSNNALFHICFKKFAFMKLNAKIKSIQNLVSVHQGAIYCMKIKINWFFQFNVLF